MPESASGTVLVLISTVVVMLIGLGIALYFQKRTKTAEDWAMGGRQLPSYVIVFTQFATLVGGGVLVGHVSIGFSYGLAPLTYGVCGAAGCFIMAIIAAWLRENEFTTIPDILEKVYGKNRFLQFVGAIMAMVVPFGWIASQATAFAKLYAEITGIDMNVLIVVLVIICVLFTIPAGFSAVAWSDFVFGVMMLALCVLTGYLALDMGGGWSNVVAAHPDPEVLSFPGGLLSAGFTTTALWFIAATPGMMTNQMTLQRVCAANSAKNARRTLIVGGILIAGIELWVVVVGNVCRALNPGLDSELASGWFLTQIPTWALALFSGFIATTIISTTDSALQSVSVNLTQDIYKQYINPNADDKKLLSVSRICTVLVAIAAVALAIAFPQVLNLIVASYAYSASGLLVPIYCGYAFRHKNILTPVSGIAGMVGGVVGCGLAQAFESSLPPIFGIQMPYAIYGILASLVCLLIAAAVTKKEKTKA
ncbi:sodium:solute symporter family protein [Pseudoflavonifractor sp. AF19-9AC]|uniref:sodium:solute symporter family protein n=1 Tax=Pseudoflavonifractor sp. AF19-9AC TaxID=2292244 RepID=UPI000E4ADAF4|nr:sodium:solute symporter family protein [Pseudoflavonifractor sp. AF19-9AC]RHR10646.1 sodium:solute symporter family protein [Pseudoflavonifractor sp. AF19-9AC]